MDIHKPKPVHNLREFLSEIVIIVIGVLIALGLEQAVEAWHWRHQVEMTEQALRADLLDSYDTAGDRIAVSDCIDRRLDELAVIVDQAGASGRLAPVGRMGNAPQWIGNVDTWESALAGQTTEHLSNARRRAYATMYGFAIRFNEENRREGEAWNELYTLVGPGRPATPAEVATWRADIGRARQENQIMGLLAVRFQQLIESSPIGKRLNSPGAKRATHDLKSPICQPIGDVPAHYGNAAFVNAIANARQTPIVSDFPDDR